MAGANIIVGQSGGPTAVINSSLYGVIREAQNAPEIAGIFGMMYGIEGVLFDNMIDLNKESSKEIELLKSTPSAALGSCRRKLKDNDYEIIINNLKKRNIRYFFYIGGNDSADTSHKIGQAAKKTGYELSVIGIPKTVDNDLEYTDHCPGYGSVARFTALCAMNAGRDTEAIGNVDNVKILETMGRNAGWIAASSCLGKRTEEESPHLVYVPEIPVVLEDFLKDVKSVYDKFGYAFVVVCEGVKNEKGESLVASASDIDTDSFGHKQLGGVSAVLSEIIKERLKIKARYDNSGTIQRMFMQTASSIDLQEAEMVGRYAVKSALAGGSDKMVIIKRESDSPYKSAAGLMYLEKIANAEKLLPRDFMNEKGNFPTEKFVKYAAPLIGEPLPEYARFKKIKA